MLGVCLGRGVRLLILRLEYLVHPLEASEHLQHQ
jgi:hypothetical protein